MQLANGSTLPDYLFLPNAELSEPNYTPSAHQWTDRVGKFQSDDTPVPVFVIGPDQIPDPLVVDNLSVTESAVFDGVIPQIKIENTAGGESGFSMTGTDIANGSASISRLFNNGGIIRISSGDFGNSGAGVVFDIFGNRIVSLESAHIYFDASTTSRTGSFQCIHELVLGNAATGTGAVGNFGGSGVPSLVCGDGSYYFRTDTPGSALQRIYVRSGGAWVGIL